MPQIKYMSAKSATNGEPFLTIKVARGYYEYAERAGRDSVAFILYDKAIGMYCLIREAKPPLDERNNCEVDLTTAFGGSLDDALLTPIEIVQQEVLEEAGYIVKLSNIQHLATTMVSTQMSQMCELYLVDVTGISQTYDIEKHTSLVWLTPQGVLNNDDWKSIMILAKDNQCK